ncbi:MAG: putative transrane anti-sigma factor [Candidatus Solibacter sp.]|nr:putative transrane anti-sigma factor [Candidatus Solibacter sp.]
MNCDSVSKILPLYYYGELTPDEEERLEAHIHECAACAREVEQQRALAAALDKRHVALPPLLLEDCRADLMCAIQGGAPRIEHPPSKGPWRLFLDAMAASFSGMGRLRQPIGALALIAIGFFAARLSTTSQPTGPSLLSSLTSPTDDVYSTVRSVQQPDSTGMVSIALDETRRRVVKGNMNDSNIQRLLLAAAHEDNPAVRVESVDLLKSQAGSTEVRDALINALSQDSNPGVRLKAIEGLKPLAADQEVRKTLRHVLLADDNVAVRMQVIDLLVAHRDDNMVGVMQGLVQRENNDTVRRKLEKALRDMNASIGTF